MVTLDALVEYVDGLLDVSRFQDYAPNGLQVEGRRRVRRLVAGVSVCQALLEAARERQADMVLVHHGFFWKNESPRVVGIKRRRLALLLGEEISLLAYHLPLDAHPALGNNVRLAQRLGIEVLGELDVPQAQGLVWHGRLATSQTPGDFAAHVGRCLGRPPLHLPGEGSEIRDIAWCSGAAQGYFEAVAARGVDAYLTGEVSEPVAHIARESGVHFFGAGHHATERYGVQALAAHLSEKFSLDWEYVEIENPV